MKQAFTTTTMDTINLRQVDTLLSHVKSGNGKCKNNPECVDKEKEWPLPPGNYRIHVPGYSPNRPKWLYLQPDKTNAMHGRGDFFIHPWGFSEGCITIYFNSDFKKVSDWAKQDGGGDLSVRK